MMKNNLKIYYCVSCVLILLCFFFVTLYPIYLGTEISMDSNKWSNFGSYVGGVIAPLLGLLAFVGVLISITNQNRENQKTERENRIHATENRIIKQIEFHHNICNNIKIPYNLKRTKFKEGRIAFEFLFEKYLKTFFKEIEFSNSHLYEEQKIDSAFSKLYNKEGQQFGFYFKNLFYLMKYIDESEGIDKIHYSRLVRAQLSKSEIQMLMYNCIFKKGKKFKIIAETYGLLNGIDKTEMIKSEHKELFANSAFE